MGSWFANKPADVRCSTCMRFGYFDKGSHQKLHRQRPTVLPDRSYDDFKKSSMRGCPFCDVVLQSFMLLQGVTPEMRVELLLYAESPVELHMSGQKESPEVVEIYPCSSRFASVEESFSVKILC